MAVRPASPYAYHFARQHAGDVRFDVLEIPAELAKVGVGGTAETAAADRAT